MGLADLFRPKWKHSNADVRGAAVKQLSAEEVSALNFVVAKDSDPAIRRMAIKKINDPDTLVDVSQNDPDESVRILAAEKLSAMLVSKATGDDLDDAKLATENISDQKVLVEVAKQTPFEEIWRLAIASIDDEKLFAELARAASEKDLREAALENIENMTILRGIAIDDDRKETAIASLEKIDDAEMLDEIVKKAKLKPVRTRAKKRAQNLRKPSPEEQERRAEEKRRNAKRAQICRGIEGLVKISSIDKARVKLDEFKSQWDEVEGQPDAEILKRYERCLERFDARIDAIKAHEAKQEEEEQRWREKQREKERQALEQKAQTDTEDTLAGESEEEKERQARARERLEKLVASVEEAATLDDNRAAFRKMKSLQRDIDRARFGRAHADLQERLNAAQEKFKEKEEKAKVEREEKAKANSKRLTDLCKQMEEALQSDNRRDVEKLMTDGQKAFRSMGHLPTRQEREDLKERYENARKKLYVHLQELREAEEWKRWTNVSKKEELCQAAEGLKDVKELKEVAQTLKIIQAQWKKSGPVNRDKADELWERFKTACDTAYARCESYFQELDEGRKENLRKKEILCEQVEALSDSEDWEDIANQIKTIQAEWKTIGPVPKDDSDAIWKRFRAACDTFFDRRKEHYEELNSERKENLVQKQELCEEVEGLVDSTEWAATTERIKALQSMWKKIGPVPRKKSDAIWKRFRSACDAFFERREESREGERMGAMREAEALCTEVESFTGIVKSNITDKKKNTEVEASAEESEKDEQSALADEKETEQAEKETAEKTPAEKAKRVLDLQKLWHRIGRLPRKYVAEINQRFKEACDAVVLAHPEAFANTDLDPVVSEKRREKVCTRLEELLEECPDQQAKPAQDESESNSDSINPAEAVEKLKAAMEANTFSGEGGSWNWHEVDAEMADMEEAWKRLGPVNPELSEKLEERYQKALGELKARRPDSIKAKDDHRGGRRRSRRRRPDNRRRNSGRRDETKEKSSDNAQA